MPCELIFLNGRKLREVILKYIDLWELGDDFRKWFRMFYGTSTLVDRIVPGFHVRGNRQYKRVFAI